ncbi:MAG: hypothetical protein QOF62_3372 [Pyrinomonadaceae bacterium]|jgi:hypothetical protein|nr:hypothetical protein [Pyrinomonadaceae bacterium]
MKFALALLITAFAALTVWGQAPTLHIVTEIPNLPSDLYYGTTKVKPLRLRPGTNTPITIADADFFVNQQYVDFLSRFPDQSGFDFWTSQTSSAPCGGDAECIQGRRDNTSGAFFLSIEFQETGYLVERMYKVAYGDVDGTSTFGGTHTLKVPIVRRSEFLPDTLQMSNGVVVNQGNWQALLESNKVAFANDFVSRGRFTAAYPASLTATQFVTALDNNAGNPLSSSERTQLISDFAGGLKTRAQVVRTIAEDQDLNNAEKNKAFVLMQYFGYLRRDPNSGPDADHTGYDFWLQKMNNHGGDFHAAQMVRSFLVSGEYLNRF